METQSKSIMDRLPHQLRVFLEVQATTEPESSIPEEWAKHEKFSFFSTYALSSWTYASVGLLMLTVFADNHHLEPKIPIPIEVQAGGIIMQSFVTYIADVHYASEDTHWHLIDRIIATINTVQLCLCALFISWIEVLLFAIVVPTGLICLSNSRHCRLTDICMHAYVRWHACWHAIYPFGVFGWLNFRAFPDYRVHWGLAGLLACALIVGIQGFHPRIFHRNDPTHLKKTT